MVRALVAALVLAAFGGEAASLAGSRLKGVSRGPSADEILQGNVVSAFESAFEAPKGKGKAPNAAMQPVQVQVDEKLILATEKQLSASCKARFSAMMDGTGPKMAAFKEHEGSGGEKQCSKLEGNICKTSAEITETHVHTDGRKLGQAMKVAGNSCIPSQCIQSDDLGALAVFMRGQVKEVMPGDLPAVSLRVDCSRSGGAEVSIDGAGALHKAAPPALPIHSSAAALPLAAAVLATLAGIALVA